MENSELLQAIQAINKELLSLKNDMLNGMHEIKKDTATLRDDFQSMQQDVIRLPKIEHNVQLLTEANQGINDKFQRLDSLEEKVEVIQMTVSVLKALTVKK